MSTAAITAALRDRLTLCHTEITGIDTSVKEYTHSPTSLGALPFVSHGVDSFSITTDASNIFSGQFVITALVYVESIAADQDNTDGSIALQTVTTLMDRFIDYHQQNPKLATTSLQRLDGVDYPIQITARRTLLADVDQNQYVGFEMRFTINYTSFK